MQPTRQLRKLIGIASNVNTEMLIPEVLHAAAIKAVDMKLILQKLPGFWNDNDLLGAKGDTKTYQFDLQDTMDADLVAPGAEIPESEEPYTSEITLKVRKIGVKPMIQQEMIEDGRFDEMARQTNRAIYKMARLVDRACGRGMTQESGAFPASGANSARLTDRQATVVGSGFTIPDDVLAMVSAIEKLDGKPTDIIMHPNFYPGIRAADWFAPSVDVQEGSAGLAGANGFVGTAYDLRWWQSKNLAYSGTHVAGSGVVIMWDATQQPFAFLNKRSLTVKNIVNDERDIVGVAFTQRFNVMNVVPSAVVWVTGVYRTYYREFKDRAL